MNNAKSGPTAVRRYVIALMFLWTLAIGAALTWELFDEWNHLLAVAEAEARGIFQKELAVRRIVAETGRKQVPNGEPSPANPHLAHPTEQSITTPSGRRVTVLNTAHLLTSSDEPSAGKSTPGTRLTSLSPLSPHNKPTPWERSALEAFEHGEKEVMAVNEADGQHYLQLARPLITTKACLQCHSGQGLKVGDVRGALSVAVPIPSLRQAAGREMLHRSIGYGTLWLLGLVGLIAGGRNLERKTGHCRHVEEALVDTLDLAQQTAMNMPGVAYQYRLRPDGTYWFPYVSEGITKMLGVTPQQVRNDPVAFFPGMLFEEDVDAIFASIDESVEKLSVWQKEMRVRAADGSIKWVSASSTPHVMPDKTVLFDGVFVDITDHKEVQRKLQEANELLEQRVAERTNELAEANRELQAEVAERRQAEMWLLQSEQRFRGYFEQGLVGMAILSPEKEWEEVNGRLCDMLGYSEKELFIKSWSELIHPDDRADDDAQFHRVAAGIVSGFSLDRRLLRKDGQTVYTTLSVKCLRGVGGKVDCLVVLVQDITQREQAEEQRESLIEALEAKNEEMERFVYTVSHDLKSPLVTIQGFLGLSEQDIEEGDFKRLRTDLGRIGDAADKMRRLLDELLELSRIGHTGDPPKPVAIGDVAREAVELVAGRLSQSNIEVHVAPDLPVLYGRRSRLREALQNLIDNAAKYMGNQPNPRIEIGSRFEAGEPVVYVRDNGIGIEPRHRDKVFRLFTKLDRESEGAGVGLALVKRIVETHDGRVWVESEGAGEGTALCFTVGLKDPSARQGIDDMATHAVAEHSASS